MDVCVVILVEAAYGVYYLLWFLCCGCVVKVNQGVVVDFSF